jgi:hypothetical protein
MGIYVHFDLYILRHQTGRQKILEHVVAGISHIQLALIFFMPAFVTS